MFYLLESIISISILDRDYCKSKRMANLFNSGQETKENSMDTIVMNLDKTQSFTSTDSKIILYGSDLSSESKRDLAKLSSKKKLKLSSALW